MMPLDIGSRRQLFVDDGLIAEHRGTQLRLHQPQPQPRSPFAHQVARRGCVCVSV
jgi:hypothetical protein